MLCRRRLLLSSQGWSRFNGFALRQNPARTVAASGLTARRALHSESSAASGEYQARREPIFNIRLAVLGFIPIFTFGLGIWQLRRLKWKISLIDELEEKLEREPLSLPAQINVSAIPDFIYRRVYLRGRWDHQHSILLGPRVREGVHGYHLVTPLIRSDGSTVLVNRGFISKESANASMLERVDGEVEVVGMLNVGQQRNYFTPDNKPEEGQWYWADVDAIAEHAGGADAGVQPVYVQEIFEGHSGEASERVAKGQPVGRLAVVDLRNAHLSYVATWFSLSALTAFMFIRLVSKRRRTPPIRLPR